MFGIALFIALFYTLQHKIFSKTETTEFKIASRAKSPLKFKIYAQICAVLGKFARPKRQISLTGLQQIGLFTLAGAADI